MNRILRLLSRISSEGHISGRDVEVGFKGLRRTKRGLSVRRSWFQGPQRTTERRLRRQIQGKQAMTDIAKGSEPAWKIFGKPGAVTTSDGPGRFRKISGSEPEKFRQRASTDETLQVSPFVSLSENE